MKFNMGHWQLQPGTEAFYPVSIVDVNVKSDSLSVTGYFRNVNHRADLLDGKIVTVRFSSPLPNVIRVQLTHFKGRRERFPAFDLDYTVTNSSAITGSDDQHAWLNAGRFSVLIPKQGQWQFTFQRDGETITTSEPQAVGLFNQDGTTYIREQLSLEIGETVYGLGEHFGPLVRNGQSVDMWNEDGGTDSEYAYKNVPFYITNKGYAVLVNNPGKVSFEVASHHVNRVQFSVEGHSLDYYIFGGPSMKDALDQYTTLCGRPAALPDWSFGLWLSTSFTTNYNEDTILANLNRMESLEIPVGVFHFDCFWMKGLTWCSFLWDTQYFPDPEGMLKRIKAKGVRICLWINPYIAESSPLFEEGMVNGYLLHTPNGDVYQVDKWQPGQGFVDFTNPAAREWYASKLRSLLDMGVDTFKTDFGERIPTEVRYHNGANPERMHNFYTYLYNQTVFELLQDAKGEGQAVVFARSATAGNQKFPVHWGGDNSSTYSSMAETLRGGLSLSLCGFGYWSHDIGGFNDTATPDLYKRWVAFGLLSSHSRLHGSSSARMPWLFDEEAVDVVRFFSHLKKHIMPYLLNTAQYAHSHGWPMMRAMILEFPDDLTCRHLDTQFMLGDSLLVAPVFRSDGEASYYLPQGLWRNLLTGEIAQGGSWRKGKYDYFALPLWVNTERGARWECLSGFSSTHNSKQGI